MKIKLELFGASRDFSNKDHLELNLKDQASINDTIDKLYLGWFFRLLFNPLVFIPRLLKSLPLFFKVLKDKVEII